MAGTECDNIGQINIKEEVEESPSASSAGESSSTVSTPSLSSSVSAPLSISVPPTQRVPPTTLSSRQDSTLNGIPYYGSMLSGVKRKSVGADPIRSKLPRSLPSLLSPPLLPSWPSFPHHQSSALGTRVPGAGVGAGYPHAGTRSPAAQDAGQNYEDEWKNIKVMLTCISGMVEKTQSAISILQQRQAESANVRNAEELMEEVQAKASLAILEVKQAALDEIHEVKRKQGAERLKDAKEEACWNCGRPGTETCSVCQMARYCGAFCQARHWGEHGKVCKTSEKKEARDTDRD